MPPKKSRKGLKGLIVAVVLIAIVFGVIASTYFMADAFITGAINSCTATSTDYEITNITLIPPSFDMQGALVIRNPSDVGLHLNRFEADIFIEYSDTIYTLGSVDVSDRSLPSGGYISVPIALHAGANVVDFLDTHPSGYDIVVSGTMSLRGTWLFWTITKEGSHTDREPM